MNQQDATVKNAQDAINRLIAFDFASPLSKNKVFLFVEGESDRAIFRHFCDRNHCQIEVIGEGKQGVQKALAQLQTPQYPLCLGICDADFEHLKNPKTTFHPHLFLTDFHDIEMMLANSDKVFCHVVSVLTGQEKDDIIANQLKQRLLDTLRFIGCLRWANELNQWELNFAGVAFKELANFTTFSIDKQQYLQRVLSKSTNAQNKDIQNIIETIENLIKTIQLDDFQICNGHNFMDILKQYINKTYKKNCSEQEVSNLMVSTYTLAPSPFLESQLYQNTQNWASQNNVVLYKQDI